MREREQRVRDRSSNPGAPAAVRLRWPPGRRMAHAHYRHTRGWGALRTLSGSGRTARLNIFILLLLSLCCELKHNGVPESDCWVSSLPPSFSGTAEGSPH